MLPICELLQCIPLTMFQFQIVWYPLYFVFVLMFSKLLAYCLLGTIAETAVTNI